ncbi:hypothetical protein D3C71_1719630 [compost metagenome]
MRGDAGQERLVPAGARLVQRHMHDGLQFEPQFLGVQHGPVLPDHPAFLQGPHAAQAG